MWSNEDPGGRRMDPGMLKSARGRSCMRGLQAVVVTCAKGAELACLGRE